MRELLGAGRLVGVDLAALRIDAGHHVLDDAVLACGVHALQNDKHRPSAVGVEASALKRYLIAEDDALSSDLVAMRHRLVMCRTGLEHCHCPRKAGGILHVLK